MPLDPNLRRRIELAIAQLGHEYRGTQGLILTEDDLKCLIYKKLSELGHLLLPRRTADDHINGVNLHSEVSWYDHNGKLAIKPDITILETENLSILHRVDERLSLPSKQFHFRGNAILLELKFIKQKSGITKASLAAIQKDIAKISHLYERHEVRNSIFCFFVVFNKTQRACREFQQFLYDNRDSNWFKVIYETGNVQFDQRRRNVA